MQASRHTGRRGLRQAGSHTLMRARVQSCRIGFQAGVATMAGVADMGGIAGVGGIAGLAGMAGMARGQAGKLAGRLCMHTSNAGIAGMRARACYSGFYSCLILMHILGLVALILTRIKTPILPPLIRSVFESSIWKNKRSSSDL